jgi:hypothetical protein
MTVARISSSQPTATNQKERSVKPVIVTKVAMTSSTPISRAIHQVTCLAAESYR